MRHQTRASLLMGFTIITLVLLATEKVAAQSIELPAEVSKRPVYVLVLDSVKDRCWTNLEDVQAALMLPMRQSGVQFTTRNEIGDLVLSISAVGSRANERVCFGALMIELAQVGVEQHPEGYWIHTKSITRRDFSAVSSDNLNRQFVEGAEATGRVIANLILEAQNPDLAP